MMRKPSRRKLSTCSSVTTRVRYRRMDELSKQPLDEFLAAVAEATPAPGGGSSAAVAAALAAALGGDGGRAAVVAHGGSAPTQPSSARPTRRARFVRGH